VGRKGFTLIELLTVVIIISILVSIALPRYLATLEQARSVEATINIGALRSSMERYWYNQHAFSQSYIPATLDKLDIDNPDFVTNRFYNYYLVDKSTLDGKLYIIKAERINKPDTYWVKWTQIGNNTRRMEKSYALGNPRSLLTKITPAE